MPEPRGAPAPFDRLGRPLGSLRLSVTDRCNLRCRYCMPAESYAWLPRASILSFEEIDRLVGIVTTLGVGKIRLTGGEPLLRHDLPTLVRLLARQPAVRDLALTTNGTLLSKAAFDLKAAGLGRLTISLDTLHADRMLAFTRSDGHASVLEGITSARQAGFKETKLNAVIIRGFNDDELFDLVEFARVQQCEIRFIEYMDVGGATDWSLEQVVSQREMVERLTRRYGTVEPVEQPSSRAPADRFRLPDGLVFGIVASTTAPFCRECDRARLMADGTLLLCLYAADGIDLREALRSGASDQTIAELIASAWRARRDRGAEERANQQSRGALYQLESLRADPHREMHTRGG